MNPNEEKQWIASLAQKLRQHQEPYREGAWEQFSGASRTVVPMRKRMYWSYAAAACLMIALGVVLWPFTEEINPTEMAHTPIEIPSEMATPNLLDQATSGNASQTTDVVSTTVEVSTTGLVPQPTAPQNLVDMHHTAIFAAKTRLPLENAHISVESQWREGLVSHDFAGQISGAPALSPEGRAAIAQISWGDPLLEDWEENQSSQVAMLAHQSATTSLQDRWQMGVELSPSVSNAQVNMGGGLHVGYQLSEKIALRSGVSLSRYGFNKGGHIPSEAVSMTLREETLYTETSGIVNDKSLVLAQNYQDVAAIHSRVWAMDIPMELQVQVSKQWYTSAGVSMLAVLDEDRTNYYLDRINQPQLSDPSYSLENAGNSFKAQYAAQHVRQPALAQQGVAGFFNFSVGRSFQLSPKLHAAVEPFFKLPFQKTTSSDLNMTNGGVKLKFGF